MTKFRFLGAVIVAGLIATPAMASDQAENTDDQAGIVSAAPSVTRVSVDKTTSLVTGRTADAIGPGIGGGAATVDAGNPIFAGTDAAAMGEGMSAGGGEGKIGVWLNGSWSDVEDDLSSTAYNGDVYSIVGGADYRFSDRFLAGLALGWESADIDTLFNVGNLESEGFSVAPYAGYVINRYFTADATIGYASGDTDLRRTSPISGSTITGEMDWDRFFAAGNLNGYYQINRFSLSGTVGILWADQSNDSFTESDTTFNPDQDIELGQLRIGGTIGYNLGKVEPYVTGRYEYDFERTDVVVAAGQAQPSNDDSGFEVGGGVRFALSERVSGAVQGTTHLARDNFESTTVSGHIRIRF